MNKKILITGGIIIIAAVVGWYFYLKTANAPKEELNQNSVINYGAQTAPLEKMPDVNPTAKTNPYKAVKTNPFE